jgi:ABC-2 type transport system ATP-binding protein
MGAAVELESLSRVFEPQRGSGSSEVVALKDVSFTIDAGEVLGLLGPNGAGKTTLVKIVSTVLLPTSGTARVLGHDVVKEAKAVRPHIGIVFGGERGLYWRLTARQNLEYWAALYKLPSNVVRSRVREVLDRVGLADRANEPVETFSRGMKQRVHLARGLIADPSILLLDEPTTGMDPVASRQFRALVQELRGEGRTILLTTHDMAEAEVLCDRVALIDHGTLQAIETPRSLANMVARYERIDVEGAQPHVLDAIRTLDGVALVSGDEHDARIELDRADAASAVLKALVDAGVVSIRTTRPSLEEVYLHMFGGRGLKV